MNAPADLIRLTQFSHGGGCGCKIAPAVLSEILAKTPIRGLPKDLLVGIESSDDAAVYRLNDEQAIVATTDFFTPIVDDPRDFGRIAATNALSDVYAMGGKPIFALAIVGMPLDKMPVEVIQRIIAGGESVCAQAGIPIAGGHSIDTLEPIYGLVALGLVHPKKVKRNDRARSGDALILGKPLGVGILSAALKKGKLSASGYKQMVEITTQLNTPGAALAELEDVHALTDVTGFGLAGHLLEICRGSKLGAEIRFDDLACPRARPTGGASSSAIRRRAGACSSRAHPRRKNAWSRNFSGKVFPSLAASDRCGRATRHLRSIRPRDHHRGKPPPHVFQENRLRLGDQVQVVLLKHLALVGHAFQQEGHERDALVAGDVAEGRAKRVDVLRAVVGRHLHADEYHARALALGRVDDRRQIDFHLRDRQPAQAVVRSKLDDDDLGLALGERCADARGAASRGFAADARIDHGII